MSDSETESVMGRLVHTKGDRHAGKTEEEEREGNRREKRKGNRRPREDREGLQGGIGNICRGLTAGLPLLCLIQSTTHNKDGRSARNCVRLTAKQRAGVQEPVMKQLWSLSWPSPAHPSPARPGFSVGRIAVSLVRQPGALGRWQGMRASGRGPLKSHLRGATPTWPLRSGVSRRFLSSMSMLHPDGEYGLNYRDCL
ncbi:hypothetical protein Q5P01_001430 [Channa striata]|uniref:Uncharacterized protein n=1 Tax=Channa striata TaxID=64152 RepID=A0AA88NMV9_CHASR|nr:hypothetical protein Q5P01_001430 [Channa striata]